MRLNIDFERMKEIYGDEIEEIINENIDIIEKNIQFLNDLKFEEKILRLKNQLGENYVEIIENDTSVLENII